MDSLHAPRSMRRIVAQRTPIWFTGAALGIAFLMIVGLMGLIASKGLAAFWPASIWQLQMRDGTTHLGLRHAVERIPDGKGEQGLPATRTLMRTGNRDLAGADFVWINDADVAQWDRPLDAATIERLEWGPFYGFVSAVSTPHSVAKGESAWAALQRELPAARRRYQRIRHLERREIGDVNAQIEAKRLALKRRALKRQAAPESAAHQRTIDQLQQRYDQLTEELERRRKDDASYRVVLGSVDGKTKELPVSSIVRAHQPNRLSWFGRAGVYLSRLREFVFDQPREANSEGGVAPAIFGTVMMTLLMSFAVVPLGVLAALYLHEYAKQGTMVSIVRIAVNNLAGVPSIVFGVFGLGFFCYLIGGSIDQLFFPERLPSPTFGGGAIIWASLTLALLTVPVVIVATEEALAAVPDGVRHASLACGATKFQTIWSVVLPAATPGILTGVILAMARGAGEVAPLMITGVVKLAPDLPVDLIPPFFHLDRKFMHLGFHIYDVGFQSPNVEASKPMVYMTALLLLGIVVCLNLAAIRIRSRLRGQLRGSEI